jgi:hypothetical protein
MVVLKVPLITRKYAMVIWLVRIRSNDFYPHVQPLAFVNLCVLLVDASC